MRVISLILFVVFAFECVNALRGYAPRPRVATCVISSPVIQGLITLTQNNTDAPVQIQGRIIGLSRGPHGFHVHEYGDISHGCESAGEHFNPLHTEHGGPTNTTRHHGDLGNIEANPLGVADIDITDNVLELFGGHHSIIGRTIVVHAGPDDLGGGRDMESRISGNSGPRLGCCIIGFANAQ